MESQIGIIAHPGVGKLDCREFSARAFQRDRAIIVNQPATSHRRASENARAVRVAGAQNATRPSLQRKLGLVALSFGGRLLRVTRAAAATGVIARGSGRRSSWIPGPRLESWHSRYSSPDAEAKYGFTS